MSAKSYVLFTSDVPHLEAIPEAALLADSPQEAAELVGAELRERKGKNLWEVVFPMSLFIPPDLGTDEMWHYTISSDDGRKIILLLDLENEVELTMELWEVPIISKKEGLA